MASRCPCCSAGAQRPAAGLWAATGTPVPNRWHDLPGSAEELIEDVAVTVFSQLILDFMHINLPTTRGLSMVLLNWEMSGQGEDRSAPVLPFQRCCVPQDVGSIADLLPAAPAPQSPAGCWHQRQKFGWGTSSEHPCEVTSGL